ncbi:4-galactosyl-N-acetylglucosaminide 3-alpha-L-fucosyltransferase FUT6-like [Mercenaria mercenaria]|uniref:4-galactosyl-N-acetylglucosaminide 3-alpha-L-fucosyltransferase FUT6-like n=1 Tax=Mercenaria mercenaria TaxID=6596 RepID=UPI00234E627C|nr:4-galactosyl-N-acetylglucosaminide 3-alpha-L-fucosyltransferase FUT6-like [Mercenaria mercenaria]
MSFRLTLRKSFTVIVCIVTLLTINTLFHAFKYSPRKPIFRAKLWNDFHADHFVRRFNSSSEKLTEMKVVNRSDPKTGELEDFTMYSLLDPKEQFETSFKKFAENATQKVLLIFNMPGFENVVTTNEKFKTCEYNNCMMTSDKSYLKTADALLFIICNKGMGSKPPISQQNRNPNQAWIFKCGETPIHHWFSDYKSAAWDNTMNWSISYRIDSDMPHPYGYLKTRTVPRTLDYESIYQAKTKTVLWVVSNCNTQSARGQYVAELQKYGVDVDIYGRCGPNHRIDNDNLNKIMPKYKFYLGFENSLCNDYVTEKLFFYYDFNWIVIVRGGADYDHLLPTKTYINTAHFSNVSLLAEYLLYLGNDKDRYVDFLRKKDRYEQKYEYGHKYSICEICRRLNNVSKFKKTYNNMRDYLENGQCRMPTDVKSSVSHTRYQNHERVFNPVK